MTKEVEAIDPALVTRMVVFIRACRDGDRSKIIEVREARDILAQLDPTPAQRFQAANPNWQLLDRAELIERVLAWKETNA